MIDNYCTMCNGELLELGWLGNYHWFRCRCCGWESYEET